MLTIRMQRTGRSGHAMFRLVVQDSRRTPTSGKIVAQVGTYDPHAKNVTLVKDKAEFYLKNGAQPSDRVARLLKAEGVKLPAWVSIESKKAGALRNPEKLRKNRPAEEASEPVVAASEPEVAEEVVVDSEPEAKAEETPAETEAKADSKEQATTDKA